MASQGDDTKSLPATTRVTYWQRFGRQVAETWLLFPSGVGVGVLVGLSVSPVTGQVVVALVTLLASVTAVLSGVRPAGGKGRHPKDDGNGGSAKNVNKRIPRVQITSPHAVGTTLLIAGVTLGAVSGVKLRTHNVLGNVPSGSLDTSVTTQNGTAPTDRATPGLSDQTARLVRQGVLFDTLAADDILRLTGASRNNIVAIAAQCKSPQVRRFAEVFHDDPELLLRIVDEVILWPSTRSE